MQDSRARVFVFILTRARPMDGVASAQNPPKGWLSKWDFATLLIRKARRASTRRLRAELALGAELFRLRSGDVAVVVDACKRVTSAR
jgi:hypothetical protein